jgi:hypothetical protein
MVYQLMQVEFQTHAQHGRTAPRIRVSDHEITVPQGVGTWSVVIEDCGTLEIDFFSKSESDTIVNNGEIVADTEFRIEKIWIDGILTETWFCNQACYRPRYFAGFLANHSDAPTEIIAPYQFNFPGTITWQWSGPFWDWYFVEKNRNEVINFLDRDPDRVWKFRGSLDPCDDLVQGIKTILNL